jgi:ElaA protein
VTEPRPQPAGPVRDAGISWRWRSFDELTLGELYGILELRSHVFVLEQACVFQDVDGLDRVCEHLIGLDGDRVVAYARVLPESAWRPGAVSIGRIVSAPALRRRGIGVELVERAVQHLKECGNRLPIELESQYRLERFYQRFGFQSVGESYIHDGQPHIIMVLTPDAV